MLSRLARHRRKLASPSTMRIEEASAMISGANARNQRLAKLWILICPH